MASWCSRLAGHRYLEDRRPTCSISAVPIPRLVGAGCNTESDVTRDSSSPNSVLDDRDTSVLQNLGVLQSRAAEVDKRGGCRCHQRPTWGLVVKVLEACVGYTC